MNEQPIKVLLVGNDSVLPSSIFNEFAVDKAEKDIKSHLQQHPADILLLNQPSVELVRQLQGTGPIIVVLPEGTTGEPFLQAGASDYLFENELSSRCLSRTIRYEIQHRHAESEQHLLAFLAQAGELLGSSLDYRTTLNTLARLFIPLYADYCMIDMIEGEEIQRLGYAHADPAKEDLLRELWQRYPIQWDGPQVTVQVLRTGQPVLIPNLSPDQPAFVRNEDHWALLRKIGVARSVISVPLVARGTTLGAVYLAYSGSRRRYDEQALTLVQEVARHAAQAVDNARLYRQAQDALHALSDQKNLLETILNQAADAVVVCNVEREILFANPAACRLVQENCEVPSTALDHAWGTRYDADGNLLPPEKWPVSRALQGEVTVGNQVHVVRDDGTYYDALVSGAPLRNDGGKIIGAVMVTHDITERQKTEQAMIQALAEADQERRRLQAVMNALPVGVSIADAKGKVIQANKEFYQIWGGNLPVTDSVEDYEKYLAWWPDTGKVVQPEEWGLSRALRNGETALGEIMNIQRFDGTRGTILNTAAPIRDGAGNIIGGTAALMDITLQLAAEEQIRLLARFPQENPSPVLRIAEDGRINYGNEAGQLVLEEWQVRVGDLLPDYWRKFALDVLKTGIGDSSEIQCKDYIFSLLFTPVVELKCVNIYGFDISERKWAEEALRLSEERLRFALQAAKMVAWDWDAEPDTTVLNGIVSAATKAAPPGFTTIHPEDEAKHRTMIEDAIRGCEGYRGQFRLLNPDTNEEIWFEDRAHITCDEGGRAIRVGGVVMNITELKRYEAALMESEKRFRVMAETVPDILFTARPDGSYDYLNQQFHTFSGMPSEQALGWGWMDMMHPDDAAENQQKWRTALASQTAFEHTYRFRRADGEYRWFVVRAYPVFNDGELVQWVGTATDIHDLKQTQEEVQKLNTELEHRVAERTAQLVSINRELEAFSYSVSHDLRAPLRAIDGFSQALLEDYSDVVNDEGKFYLQRVRAASQKMGHLIDDLLKLSRLTRTDIQRETVDLSAMVEDVANGLRDENRAVEWVIQPGVMANGDPHLLRVVMENLINNAWKFTSKQDKTRIEFGVLSYNNETVYFVRDNGAGFDMTYVDKLFGAFQRLHASNEFEGTGIGLATAQRIIHRHGGRIWAESTLNQGAAFFFTLHIQE